MFWTLESFIQLSSRRIIATRLLTRETSTNLKVRTTQVRKSMQLAMSPDAKSFDSLP